MVKVSMILPGLTGCLLPLYKYLCWGLITQSLMRSLQVVEVKVSPYSSPDFFTSSICFQIHLLVLQTPPQPLHKDVVGIPSLPIHADPNSCLQQHPSEGVTGEL